MKKILIAGPGNSGSGAVLDYLKSRQDTFLPFSNEEFRIVCDPNGISSLEDNFFKNFSINNSANAYHEFKKFCENLSCFKNQKKELVYPEEFSSIFKGYLNDIKYLDYNGLPRFQKFKLSFFEKLNYLTKTIILKENIRKVNVFKMVLPIHYEEFLQITKNFIDKIIVNSKEFQKNKVAVLDQCVNIFNLEDNIKYFRDSKCIITLRNPIGTYHSIFQNPSMAYAGLDTKKFIKWYKFIYNKINKLKSNENCIIINFEDFVLKNQETKDKIHSFFDLDEQKTNFNIKDSFKNVTQIENEIEKESLKLIKSELKEFISN